MAEIGTSTVKLNIDSSAAEEQLKRVLEMSGRRSIEVTVFEYDDHGRIVRQTITTDYLTLGAE